MAIASSQPIVADPAIENVAWQKRRVRFGKVEHVCAHCRSLPNRQAEQLHNDVT